MIWWESLSAAQCTGTPDKRIGLSPSRITHPMMWWWSLIATQPRRQMGKGPPSTLLWLCCSDWVRWCREVGTLLATVIPSLPAVHGFWCHILLLVQWCQMPGAFLFCITSVLQYSNHRRRAPLLPGIDANAKTIAFGCSCHSVVIDLLGSFYLFLSPWTEMLLESTAPTSSKLMTSYSRMLSCLGKRIENPKSARGPGHCKAQRNLVCGLCQSFPTVCPN